MKETYGIGVLGFGTIARWITDELDASDRFRIVAAFDPAPKGDVPYPMRPTAAEVCRDPAVDCVYIASPPRWHREGVELAVRHRKAILCEKPLAPGVKEAEELADLVAESGMPNVVNFGFQTMSTGRSLRAAVERQLMGPVVAAEVRLRLAAWPQRWHAEAGSWLTTPDQGGYTREVMTHFMALADQVLGTGTVEDVDLVRGPDGLETSTKAHVRYGSVLLAADAALDPTIEAEGDLQSRFAVRCERGEMAIEDWTTARNIPVLDPRPDGLAEPLAQHLDGGPSDLQDFRAGARVARVIETILSGA